MSFYSKIYGGEGTATSPLEPSFSHIIVGARRVPNEPAHPWAMQTNGDISILGNEAPRTSGLVGQCMMPIVPCFPLDDGSGRTQEFWQQIENLLGISYNGKKFKYAEGEIHKLFEFTEREIGPEPSDKDIQKWMVSAYGSTPMEGFVTWEDPRYRYITCTKTWYNRQLTELQRAITLIGRAMPQPAVLPVGYSLVKYDRENLRLEVEKFPSDVTEVTDRSKVRYNVTVDPFPRTAARTQALYLLLPAMQFSKFMEIEDYTLGDYVALLHSYLMQYVQVGNPTFDNWWSALDIVDRVQSMFGSGINEANPFIFHDHESLKDYLHFTTLFGLAVARTVPTTAPADIWFEKGSTWTITAELQRLQRANMDSVGGRTLPYYVMPTNYARNAGFYLPSLLRRADGKDGLGVGYENKLEYVDSFVNPPSISTMEVRHGETTGTGLASVQDQREVLWYRWITPSDARHYTISYPMRLVSMFRLPTHYYYPGSIDQNAKGDAKKRRLIYALSLLTGANDSMKRGWFINPGLGMVKDVMSVTYLIDERFEIKIIRDAKEGPVEPAPGSVMQGLGAGVKPIPPSRKPAEIQVQQTTPVDVAKDVKSNQEAAEEAEE